MSPFKKRLLSVFSIVLFMFFAVASKVNKIHYGAFNYNNHVEDRLENRNYLLKNDGTRVYGESISWKSGIIVKNQIKINDEKFRIADIIGYRSGDFYYGRLGSGYIKRIVHGRINIYVEFTNVTSTSTSTSGISHTRSYIRTDQYSQRGDTGPMKPLAGQEDIKEIVSDCPLAVQMADLKNSAMRKAIKKDPNYLNSIFDVYNNDCREVEQSIFKRQ